MFRDDFKAEVDYLFQLCDELGRREPTLAPMLGRGADPSVSRLVEGLAFSFGRLRQRLDDDMPEIIHPIVDNLCPEILRPIPSGTIIELTPSAKMLSRQAVRAGSTFASRPIDGVSCLFRSTVECEVSPWVLRRIDVASPDRRAIKIVLELFGGTELASAAPSVLRLFLAHPVAAALEARAFLLQNAVRTVVRSPQSDAAVTLPRPIVARLPSSVRSVEGTRTPEDPMLPNASAFLALRDYFVFPQSFAFVELPGFDAVAELGPGVRSLEIDIELAEPLPKGILLDPSTVLLHAVPALNVFRPPKLSVQLGADKRRCHLRFEGELEDAEVYAVESVALVSRGLRTTPLQPWARFFPPPLDGSATDVRYEVHRVPSVIGPRLDVSLSFSAAGIDSFLADKLAVEVEMLATNGARASSVGLGDICLSTAMSPSLVSFRNVTTVTRNAAPPIAGDRLWRFFRLTKANLASLTDSETLGAVLALANVPALDQWPDAKPGVERFTPLLGAERQRSCASDRDELRSGAVVRLALDGRRFTGPGDLRLFGEVLVPLFAASIAVNEWVELVLVDAAGHTLERYPRTYGARVGL
jgi:type VI secretion system protein ImpG